jgi:hypothetical protein
LRRPSGPQSRFMRHVWFFVADVVSVLTLTACSLCRLGGDRDSVSCPCVPHRNGRPAQVARARQHLRRMRRRVLGTVWLGLFFFGSRD